MAAAVAAAAAGDADDAAAADVAIFDANGRDVGNVEQEQDECHRQSARHIRQLAHINLTCLPLLSRADRSKTLVGSVRQIVVARPSFVESLVVILAASRRAPVPFPLLSISPAETGRSEGGALRCSVGHVSASPARHGSRSVAAAKQRRAAARRFKPQSVGRSVCQCALYLHFDAERNKFAAPSVIATRAGIAETARQGRSGRPAACPVPIDSPDAWRVAREVQRARSGRTDRQNE